MTCEHCSADRPAGLSEEERAALVCENVGRVARRFGTMEESDFATYPLMRESVVAHYRAARAPLEAELKTERAMKEGCQDRLRALAAYVREAGVTQDDDEGDTVEKARLSLRMLRERVRELENSLRMSEHERLDLGEILAERTAQLAQAQRPAAKSLADMIAESTTLAMGQRTSALETMIREFLKQTGVKVEDCMLVEQMEGTKLTWSIEHRPKPAAPAGLPDMKQAMAQIDEVTKRFLGHWRFGFAEAVVNAIWSLPPAQASREPAASPPGEVSTETPNLDNVKTFEPYLDDTEEDGVAMQSSYDGAWLCWEDAKEAAKADIRAAVERATAKLRDEVERLKMEVAQAKAPKLCTADGMSNQELGLAVSAYGTHEERGAKARELFTPSDGAKPQGGNEGQPKGTP